MNAVRKFPLFLLILIFVFAVGACGAPAEEEPADAGGEAGFYSDREPPSVEMAEPDMDAGEDAFGAPAMEMPPPMGTSSAPLTGGSGDQSAAGYAADRMIIKSADMNLLVEQTDVAIDRLTQIVADYGGYIISSREWYTDWYGENFKYSTYTFAVPVDQFERALSRLRAIAVRVLNEQASGEDVTEEFVDLESRLRNLEATRDRIRTFLEQARTVEEALEVNRELSEIDSQIEETKGRMNYLAGRAAYSTITVTLEPQLPDFVPTETPTPTATNTPTATPTATPWKPGETLGKATKTLGGAYRNMTEALIWLLVVFLPILAPFVLLLLGLRWAVLRRLRPTPPPTKKKE